MNKQISVLESFQETDLNIVFHENLAWIPSTDIGLALGYSSPNIAILKVFDRNREELEPHSVLTKLVSTDGKRYETRVFNETGVMIICMLSKQPKAAEFRAWAVEILKAYRRGELTQKDESDLNRQLISTLREFRLGDQFTKQVLLNRVTEICRQLRIPVPALAQSVQAEIFGGRQ